MHCGSTIQTTEQDNLAPNKQNNANDNGGIALHCGLNIQTTKQTNSRQFNTKQTKQRKKDSHLLYEKGGIDDIVSQLHQFALHNDNCYLGDRMML